VVEEDPEAPDVTISFPPGEYLTSDEWVDVTGTVTDASGVASFSINGQLVELGAEGSFTYFATGLTVGENVPAGALLRDSARARLLSRRRNRTAPP